MKKALSSFVFIFLTLFGCANKSAFENPPRIKLGQDPCDNCYMIINEKKFAGSLWLKNGNGKRFDDSGEMINYINKNKRFIQSSWVYDYYTEEPVLTEKAFYIISNNIVTPMGLGLVSFELEGEAKNFAEKHNTGIFSYNQLKIKNNLE